MKHRYGLLRLTRVVVAALSLFAATALFASYGTAFPGFAAWLARIQLLPAALAFAMGIFVTWIIVTLLLGRVYCSTVCPLGLFQDLCARLPRIGRRQRERRAYHYRRPLTRLRYTVLAVTVAALVVGFSAIPTLVDPYSAFGRMASEIVKPAWGWILNIFGDGPVRVACASVLGLGIAVLTAIAVGWIAAKSGRTVCNTVCPVGTTLGLVGRYSVFHIDIDTDKCIQCRKCEHECKSSCIDMESHVVDMSRCVVCFDCLPVCPNDAIDYTLSSHRLVLPMLQRAGSARRAAPTAIDSPAPDSSVRRLDRRRFMAAIGTAVLLPAAVRADRVARRVTAAASPGSVRPGTGTPVMPPGAADPESFLTRCTGCGLCVSHCPTGIMRPSTRQYGLSNMLAPLLDYELGRCAWDCTLCNNLCPTGALVPLTLAEKRHAVIGRAEVTLANCVHCGRCERACPRHAIAMTGEPRVPRVDTALCIGCGACQYVCPAYPYKAINVDGIAF